MQGYWQVPLREGAQNMCTMSLRRGESRTVVFRLGMSNVTEYFQAKILDVLRGETDKICLVRVVDVVIGGKTPHTLLERLLAIWIAFSSVGIFAAAYEAVFFKNEIKQ